MRARPARGGGRRKISQSPKKPNPSAWLYWPNPSSAGLGTLRAPTPAVKPPFISPARSSPSSAGPGTLRAPTPAVKPPLISPARSNSTVRYTAQVSHPAAVLFIDTSSPVSSVAVGAGYEVLAERTIEQRRTSELLLSAIEEALVEAGVELGALGGIAALQGPGSFTGLRIGLATVLGLHQASGVRATALPTLPILAAAAQGTGDDSAEVLAAVDAMRGDWVVQRFRTASAPRMPATTSERELVSGPALREQGVSRWIGFGIRELAGQPWLEDARIQLIEPPPLAAIAARSLAAEEITWSPERLTAPIYFRPPAVTLPKA